MGTASTNRISPKDKIIMQLIADGLRLSQIAEETWLTERAVENRISRLKKQLGCRTITHAAIKLLRAKIIK